MRDGNLNNEAPAFLFPEYDFHVSEGSITGQKVGQMEADFMDGRKHGIITYRLIGPGSELYILDISLQCIYPYRTINCYKFKFYFRYQIVKTIYIKIQERKNGKKVFFFLPTFERLVVYFIKFIHLKICGK